MASTHEYKRFENRLVRSIKSAALTAAGFIAGIFVAIWQFLTRRYTLVFVPHSEKKVYNFHVTILSMLCFLLVMTGIFGAFFWYGASYSNTRSIIASQDMQLRDTRASLDQMRDETAALLRESRNFENALSTVLSMLGLSSVNSSSPNLSGDLTSLLGIREFSADTLPEVNELRRISELLSQSENPILEIGNLLEATSQMLTEIPSIWPVQGGIGRITMFFGQNVHPMFGHFYIHRGIDISTHRSGDPVVAAANGQVVTAEYDASGFGNNIIIRHRHGYYTRYAHLSSFRVNVGQRVQQGDVIGFIGNTGLSTGPHLHFEVQIGSDVVDPFQYITRRTNPSLHRR
ncbi:MAG: M23 family metallopeptidase [Treponema sp.]|nr:M23 family metallopeptidase [Treponema sp.]